MREMRGTNTPKMDNMRASCEGLKEFYQLKQGPGKHGDNNHSLPYIFIL